VGGEIPDADVTFGKAGCDFVLLRVKVETVHAVVGVEKGVHCDAGWGGLWAETDLFAELACHFHFCFDVDALTILLALGSTEGRVY
jgi:hypothetical protein